MKYEEFKHGLIRELKNHLPIKYQNWQMEIREIPKINGFLEGLHLIPEDGTGASPTIYLGDLYAYYEKSQDLERTCQRAATIFVTGMDYAARMEAEACLDLPRDKVFFTLINQAENRRLLEQVPHRITLDLALIYRIMLHDEDGGFNSAIITHNLAEEMNLTEEELYELAMENTPKILPVDRQNMDDVFAILTNEKKVLGASAMMYPGVLEETAEKMDCDLFILPSSIHEVFLIPAIGQDVSDMNRIVAEGNKCVVKKEEILSSHVYFYDRENDMVRVPLGLVGY